MNGTLRLVYRMKMYSKNKKQKRKRFVTQKKKHPNDNKEIFPHNYLRDRPVEGYRCLYSAAKAPVNDSVFGSLREYAEKPVRW